MALIIVSFFVLLSVVCLMAIGVMFGRKPIAGSCGGVGAALGEKDYVCELCGGDEAKCEEIKSQVQPSSTPFTNASPRPFQSDRSEK
ncbi:MAG TPA: (Na+)-NQR maturation NqrM [Cellvibrio sp.]|mgnify:CR=1 FL=1|nr:(Na+)-NQR maturation NqrM [Cellvibrio sp.]